LLLKPTNILWINKKVVSLCFEATTGLDISVFRKALLQHFPSLEEVTHSFDRVNLLFKSPIEEESILKKIAQLDWNQLKREQPTYYWEIPICFNEQYPNDLVQIFHGDQNAIDHYKTVFLSATYRLEFYGFLPGFGYLSGLPKQCHLDRKLTANRKTLIGTVAVGGEQVGVYPQDSPGGWQAIGYSPLPWIQAKQAPYVFIQPGEAIRFVTVDLQECKAIAKGIETGHYQPKKVML
jgi:inhibitor of KinA